jgi:hypothetical protein
MPPGAVLVMTCGIVLAFGCASTHDGTADRQATPESAEPQNVAKKHLCPHAQQRTGSKTCSQAERSMMRVVQNTPRSQTCRLDCHWCWSASAEHIVAASAQGSKTKRCLQMLSAGHGDCWTAHLASEAEHGEYLHIQANTGGVAAVTPLCVARLHWECRLRPTSCCASQAYMHACFRI